MKAFYKIIISDYKQRTRSYAFLVTLAISLYFAYCFVPAPGAAYTTLRIGNYTGVQNSAWIGYVTAMMTSVFLSMIGFYLVNSSIKKDLDTGVGMIVATTSISNFNYLFAKALCSFLVLLSITACVFLMGIALFFVRSAGYPFEIMQFISPYLIITVPTIFFIAALAAVAEVFLYRYTIVMNIAFFFFFCAMGSLQTVATAPDLFGNHPVTMAMEQTVLHRYPGANHSISMGFIFGSQKNIRFFEFEGIHWTARLVLSRIFLPVLALFLIFIASRFFHRFDIKQKFKVKKHAKPTEINLLPGVLRDIKLSSLPPIIPAFGILPFIKTELLMLFRKGPRWLWLFNLGGMVVLLFAPLAIAHQIVLPILWFLQVGRWSDLATKEKTNRIHYFTFASYKPLTRLLPAQILSGIVLASALALPLMVRYLFTMQLLSVLSIIMGAIFIVLFAVALGILSGGKKLFEILFFLFTYLNIEKAPFTDYFGGVNHGINYVGIVTGLVVLLGFISFVLRGLEIKRA